LHGALEALPSLPGSGTPAIYLKKCEPFDLGIELVGPRVKVVTVPGLHEALEAFYILTGIGIFVGWRASSGSAS
jgi:hypothetical protein